MWRVSKEAGRPFPRVSDDDVIDFMVTEAVAVKIATLAEVEQDNKKRKDWRSDRQTLKEAARAAEVQAQPNR